MNLTSTTTATPTSLRWTTNLGDGETKTQGRDWLPDMDLNHDKQIQSLLCYRYTIGQRRVLKVGFSARESSTGRGSARRLCRALSQFDFSPSRSGIRAS